VLVLFVAAALVTWSGGAQAARPSVDQRLLKAGELAGFEPLPTTTYRDALRWAVSEGLAGDTTAEQHWLERAGFVTGTYEQLATPKLSSRSARSFVIQFRTAAGARADVPHEIARQQAAAGVKAQSFDVAGIPGAQGIVQVGPGGEAHDVFFVDGRFSYGVLVFSPDKHRTPTTAQVAAAALRLYRRVHPAVA
jgi:hypothetical protein